SQAEDGIRDRNVTGVQTCALPISSALKSGRRIRKSGKLEKPPAALQSSMSRRAVALPTSWRKNIWSSFRPPAACAITSARPKAKIGRASCREKESLNGGVGRALEQ